MPRNATTVHEFDELASKLLNIGDPENVDYLTLDADACKEAERVFTEPVNSFSDLQRLARVVRHYSDDPTGDSNIDAMDIQERAIRHLLDAILNLSVGHRSQDRIA